MNIVRALEVALPELPEQIVRKYPPKLDPKVIAKEHIEKGKPVVLTKMPGTDLVFRFSPLQWKLIQMFDGDSSFEDIAARFGEETGVAASEEDVKELASYLQTSSQLLYKSPLERNITLQQELRLSHTKRRRSRTLDFSDLTLKTWKNPDNYISWLYPKVRFLFTPRFVWLSLALFVLMAWMWADRFGEIWSDSFAYYNFMHKSGWDLVEFWVLFGSMAVVHETGHGLVGKHFGATIEKMAFSLMYFAPSFICDATQVWVIGGKWARIATAIAGIWIDLLFCFVATVVWWGTAPGMPAHDWAYKVMIITGIGVSVLNLNPLIKLDGYLIFSELVSEPSLKESSTAYLTSWVRKNIFRLPVDVVYVPRRKRLFFVVYAVLSGLYSYSLLSFLMIVTYHILSSFMPELAFAPALAIGYWVFRSRIHMAVRFMKMLYLDKKQRVKAWLTPSRLLVATALGILLLFGPIWPDSVDCTYVLEATQSAVIRATVPGMVRRVSTSEGAQVQVGSPLLSLANLNLESNAEKSRAELLRTTARASAASQQYSEFAEAEQERLQSAVNERLSRNQIGQLSVVSPIAGTVTTPHLADLVGRPVSEGDVLLEVAGLSDLRARLYVPEFSMSEVRIGQRLHLLVPGQWVPSSASLVDISPAPSLLPTGLFPKEQLQGINPPRFYLGTGFLKYQSGLLPGMSGQAKILVGRRSLAGFAGRFVRDLVQRKVW
jgi:putative peptide zinc metalloprotease protein